MSGKSRLIGPSWWTHRNYLLGGNALYMIKSNDTCRAYSVSSLYFEYFLEFLFPFHRQSASAPQASRPFVLFCGINLINIQTGPRMTMRTKKVQSYHLDSEATWVIFAYGPALFNIHGSILKQSKFERNGDKEKKVWTLKAGTLSIAQRSRVRVRTRTSSSPLPCFSVHCIGGSTSGRRHCWFNVAAPQVPQCYLSVSEG